MRSQLSRLAAQGTGFGHMPRLCPLFLLDKTLIQPNLGLNILRAEDRGQSGAAVILFTIQRPVSPVLKSTRAGAMRRNNMW